jgi:hypothetical protein
MGIEMCKPLFVIENDEEFSSPRSQGMMLPELAKAVGELAKIPNGCEEPRGSL